jgi:hypothetical protein
MPIGGGQGVETYIRVRGQWRYLYRAIGRDGALVDVMLSEHRDLTTAKAFFRSAKTVTGVTPSCRALQGFLKGRTSGARLSIEEIKETIAKAGHAAGAGRE